MSKRIFPKTQRDWSIYPSLGGLAVFMLGKLHHTYIEGLGLFYGFEVEDWRD